ncbi:MAG: hypothetical protein RLZZ519_2741 [Bacteroidota bacterium]|jgi:hypothetical protein
MATAARPDKGNDISTYRDGKLNADWQKERFDQVLDLITTAYPTVKARIKWAQPVWETAEGPMIFFRGASKHVTIGFWRGAEFLDPDGLLEGEGDRMKHLKIKEKDEVAPEILVAFIQQAIALNAQKGDPTKGK